MKKLILFLLIPVISVSQKNYPQLLEQYMKAQTDVRDFSGAVLVMKQNKVLLRKGYGMADREWKVPNVPESKFRIGSVTKQFTAACILQLAEAGKLSLDDKLGKYFPGFPKGDSVTIHMLLNHTSGVPSYTDQPDFMKVAVLPWSKDSIIGYFKQVSYNFSPGTSWAYSNSGYFLLGCIIEKAGGQSYSDYLREHILDKLDMKNTGTDRLDTLLPKRARGYSKNGKETVNADYISMEWPFSAGVMYSTLDDLYTWDRALYNNSVLSSDSRKKMFTPGRRNYGYGIIIDSLEGHYRIWHNGGIPGFSTNFTRFPDDDICVIVYSNNETNTDFISIALADILFDVPVELPYVHREIKIDPAILERYTGKYGAGLTIELIVKDGKLYRHRNGTPDIELKPESETRFFYGDGSDRMMEFEVDNNGKVVKLWFHNSGQKGELKKIE